MNDHREGINDVDDFMTGGDTAGDNEELSEEDKLFGKATSNNQDENDGSSIKVDIDVVEASLNAIMSNLDLFWKRSEEYPVECLAEGKRLHMCLLFSCIKSKLIYLMYDNCIIDS